MYQYVATRATSVWTTGSTSRISEFKGSFTITATGANTGAGSYTQGTSVTSWTSGVAMDNDGGTDFVNSTVTSTSATGQLGMPTIFSAVVSIQTNTQVNTLTSAATGRTQTGLTGSQSSGNTTTMTDVFGSTMITHYAYGNSWGRPATYATAFFYSTRFAQGQILTSFIWSGSAISGGEGSGGSTNIVRSLAGSVTNSGAFSNIDSTYGDSYISWSHVNTTEAGNTTTAGPGAPLTSTSFTVAVAGSQTSSLSTFFGTFTFFTRHSSDSYNYTTTTSTTATTDTVTTGTTTSYTFPTATTTAGTFSTYSSYTQTTTRTIAATDTYTTYASTTAAFPFIRDTILEVGTNDWVWVAKSVTSTSPNVTDLASSVTAGTYTLSPTFTTSGVGVFSQWSTTHTGTVAATSTGNVGFTSWQATSSVNLTSTVTTTSSSTYLLAGPTSVADTLSLSQNTSTVSVSYVTTTNTTFSFFSSITRTTTGSFFNVPTAVIPTYVSTSTFTYNTTDTGGLFSTSFTYTIPRQYQFFLTSESWTYSDASNTSATSAGTVGFPTGSLSSSYTTLFAQLASFTPTFTTTSTIAGPLTVTVTKTSFTHSLQEPFAQPGFQAGSSLGSSASSSVGTNVTAAIALPQHYAVSSVINGGPMTPVWATDQQAFGTLTTYGDSSTAWSITSTATTGIPTSTTTALPVAFGTAGAVSQSNTAVRVGPSTIGGNGWNTTYTTNVSVTGNTGLHRYTSFDSTGGSTLSTQNWSVSHSFSVPPGNQVVVEALPVYALGFNTQNFKTFSSIRLAAFPAFPST